MKFKTRSFLISCWVLLISGCGSVFNSDIQPYIKTQWESLCTEDARNRVVKITNRRTANVGTGLIVEITQNDVYILTASDVVEGERYPIVEFNEYFYGKATVRVLHTDEDHYSRRFRGLALLMVEDIGISYRVPRYSLLYCIERNTPIEWDRRFAIDAIGFTPRRDVQRVSAKLLDADPDKLVLHVSYNEVTPGSPLIQRDRIIGMITTIEDGRHAHAVSTRFIRQFLGRALPVAKRRETQRREAQRREAIEAEKEKQRHFPGQFLGSTLPVAKRRENQKREAQRREVEKIEAEKEKQRHSLARMNLQLEHYYESGQFEQALPLAERVLKKQIELWGKEDPNTLVSMNNLAVIYQTLGRFDNAFQLFSKIVEVRTKQLGKAHPQTLISMNNLATVYQMMNRFDKALSLYDEVFRLRKEKNRGETDQSILISLHNLANIHQAMGHFKTALSLYKKSVALHKDELGETHPSTLNTMNGLAESYQELNLLDKALPIAQKSKDFCLKLLGKEHPYTLESLDNLATIYAKIGELDKSIELLVLFVNSVETLRTRGDLSTENRQALFKQWTDGYFNLSRFYVNKGRNNNAFLMAEKTKARTLLDSMALKLAAQKAGLSQADQQTFQNNQARIVFLNDKIARETDMENRLALEIDKNQSVRQAAEFHRTLRKKYPKYAQLSDIQFVDAKTGASIIPSEALFISYLMLDNHVLVFTLDSTGDLQSHDLGEIAGLEQTLKIYQQLLGEKCTIKELHNKKYLKLRPRRCELFDKKRPKRLYVWQLGDGSFVITKKTPSRDKKPKKKVYDLDEISRYLGQQLLAPIKDRLDTKARWIISPDGMLAQIPFETLIVEEQPVIAQHEISYVQSLSVLALLKAREQAYQSLKGRNTLLAIGAPRYHLPGNRPKTCNQPTRAPDFDIEHMLARNANDPQRYEKGFKAKDIKWCNLPGAEKELAALEKLFADKRPLIYKQAEASETNLQRLNREQELTRYRYLVFSAHGYFDGQTPALSVIVLDQLNKTPETDGYITASEWPSYDFKSDLMVLSACQTGQGKVLHGEGVLGLPYAFYVAGNKNTLMTLWTVQDESTAEFTARFFEKLKAGMNQVKALTETKREFMNSDKYKRPLFWAPFVLYGI